MKTFAFLGIAGLATMMAGGVFAATPAETGHLPAEHVSVQVVVADISDKAYQLPSYNFSGQVTIGGPAIHFSALRDIPYTSSELIRDGAVVSANKNFIHAGVIGTLAAKEVPGGKIKIDITFSSTQLSSMGSNSALPGMVFPVAQELRGQWSTEVPFGKTSVLALNSLPRSNAKADVVFTFEATRS